MAEYTIIKMKHLAPLHIGTGKENYDFSASELQSDTLSAALCAIRAQMGKVNDLEEFLNSFTLSSAFPYYGDSYYFPKPQGKIDVEVNDKEEIEYRKKLKKVRYIEYTLWKKMIAGEKLRIDDEQLQSEFIHAHAKDSNSQFYKSQVNQRVTVPRADGQDAAPFFFEWKYFNKEAGLYCLTDAKGELLDEIISLFKMLGESGIGTDRTVGGGRFEVEVKDKIEITEVKNSNAEMLLSLFIPSELDFQFLNLNESKYELILRGGYISGSQEETFRHLRKKSVYMFNVGSVFHSVHPLQGKVVNLRPEWNDSKMHGIFRSGRALTVSIKL
jgi:CRISPR type III-A-associated RAMP protein Csm4